MLQEYSRCFGEVARGPRGVVRSDGRLPDVAVRERPSPHAPRPQPAKSTGRGCGGAGGLGGLFEDGAEGGRRGGGGGRRASEGETGLVVPCVVSCIIVRRRTQR